MEAYKIAGGVAAGVGVVAALPVLGAIGSVSLLGAILGGTVGGVAGAIASEIEDDQNWDRRASQQDAEEEELEEAGEETNPWLLALEGIRGELDKESFGGLVVMLHAMNRCANRVDGVSCYSPDWMMDIREMVREMEFSDKAKEEIELLDKEPTTLHKVVAKVAQMTSEAKAQAAALLDELIPEKETKPSGKRRISRVLSADSGEVVELVKSLLREELSREQQEA